MCFHSWCEQNSPVTGEFPAQRTINAENVSIWWLWNTKKLIFNHVQRSNYTEYQMITMMTSSNGNSFRVTVPLCGEFTGHWWIPHIQRPVTWSFDVFFDLRLNKRLSKQSRGRWFETPSGSLWRHCNVLWHRHTQWWAGVGLINVISIWMAKWICTLQIEYLMKPGIMIKTFCHIKGIFDSKLPTNHIALTYDMNIWSQGAHI